MSKAEVYCVTEDNNTITVGTLNSLGKFIPRKKGFKFFNEAFSWYENRKAKKKKSYGYGYSKELRKTWRKAFKKYAEEGEDEKILPDFLDYETDNLL